jgi:4-hydroxy-tetrahydrodipicolinate reductase
VKIALHGYGKMGKAVEQAAATSGHQVVAWFDHRRKIGEGSLNGAEAIVDFSSPEALDGVIEAACRFHTNLVIGTTGWSERLDEVRKRCSAERIGVVYAPNFSPGAIVFLRLARDAGLMFKDLPEYEAGIEERHHSQKKDAPSGTALRLAGEVKTGSGGRLEPSIASSRVGAEFGLHTLFFDSPQDLVEISHRARGRMGFAHGALMAAVKVKGRVGFFSFEELLFSEKGSA